MVDGCEAGGVFGLGADGDPDPRRTRRPHDHASPQQRIGEGLRVDAGMHVDEVGDAVRNPQSQGFEPLGHLGEACTAANRIYVHEDVAADFTRRLAQAMSALKVGDGTDPSVDVGPLVNASTRDKVAEFVEDAVAKGATLECGGTIPEGTGFFYPPTVLSNVPETADCVHDEIFGPVAAIQTFTDQEDVIRRANDTEYGLVAYVFSEDFKRALQVCERLDYGMVGLNRGLVSDPAAPFGGTKQSGLGREGGHEGMLEFMETQYISASW